MSDDPCAHGIPGGGSMCLLCEAEADERKDARIAALEAEVEGLRAKLDNHHDFLEAPIKRIIRYCGTCRSYLDKDGKIRSEAALARAKGGER